MKALKRFLPAFLLVAAYLFLVFLLFRNATSVSRGYGQISLRYNTSPLSAAQVASARHTLGNPDLTPAFQPTFWYEEASAHISTGNSTAETPALYVDGDMAYAMPVTFLSGTYPSALEKQGVAMSEGLAWALFGSPYVVGTSFEWMGEDYTVRGVFQGEDNMLLVQVDPASLPETSTFTGVELTGTIEEGDPREAATAFAGEIGLSTPEKILDGSMITGLFSFLAWLPAVLLILWFAARIVLLLHRTAYWKRQLVWFAVLLLLALGLPRAMDLLPGWMVPTRWSDFDHWSSFFRQVRGYVTEWLSLVPSLKDVELKRMLIGQFLLTVPTLFVMVAVILRWNAGIRRKEARMLQEAAEKAEMPSQVVTDILAAVGVEAPKQISEGEPHPEDDHEDDLLLLHEKQWHAPDKSGENR